MCHKDNPCGTSQCTTPKSDLTGLSNCIISYRISDGILRHATGLIAFSNNIYCSVETSEILA